jgi:hypothetical protein
MFVNAEYPNKIPARPGSNRIWANGIAPISPALSVQGSYLGV